MNIDLPSGWSEKGGGVENCYYLAENSNGVCIGYKHLGPGKFSIFAGENWSDSRTIATGFSSKSEAQLKALEFMQKYPDVTYESGTGLGTLRDEDGHIASI